MEKLFNSLDYPQEFIENKKLWDYSDDPEYPNTIGKKQEASAVRRGTLATFSLKIIFRQNASWQGSIGWLEENKKDFFRSFLELLKLIDSALSSKVLIKA